MTTAISGSTAAQQRIGGVPLVYVTLGLAAACFATVVIGLVQAWIGLADAAHGILIAPVAVWLAWRDGVVEPRRPAQLAGGSIVLLAVLVNLFGRVAGVDTIPRAALLLALVGLTVWYAGWRQVFAWWLPFVLVALTIPLPESIIASLTFPLQGVAAKMGAAMLSWRHIPLLLNGNIIRLPGHVLFVSEACSGLRSLTALLSMSILVGALFLRHWASRIAMVLLAVALAIVVNGVRIFMTGFLVFFVDPKLGDGFMHLTEGYLLFLISLSILAVLTLIFTRLENRFDRRANA